MNKKLFFMTLCLVAAVTGNALAYLPTTSISSMTLPVYGIYMTSDSTCTTNLVATIPLSTTPKSINFVSNPIIGTSSSLPSTVGCVVIVIQNNFSSAWAAGIYAGTSGGNSDNIVACTGGGSSTGQAICNNGVPTWPSKVTTDAAAIGLSLKTSNCTTHTATDVVPLVLSTNSTCTGNATTDSGIGGCTGNTNNYALPLSVGDTANGTRLTAPSTSGNFKFVVNPINAFGATGGATCGNTAAPLFSFTAM
jgi:hypothetical protein